MTETKINFDQWHRKEIFNLFRRYEKPHYAITSRVNVTSLMGGAQSRAISPYRACLYAIGAGIHAVPELMTRFRGDNVVQHNQVALSMTVPQDHGGFGYAYVPFDEDFTAFDASCSDIINSVAKGGAFEPHSGSDDVVYLSCLPWIDYTSYNNALPHADDCIPRITWGKFIDHGTYWDMAMTIEVHHALVDGEHIGTYFQTVNDSLAIFMA